MKGVRAARVHLVLSDPGSFRQAPQAPSASVVVRSDPGQLPSAAAIRQLVSSAVPGLTPEHVAVLSTDGTILAAGGEAGAVSTGKMLDLEKQVSREIDENIRKTLVPFLGLGNFEASVSARLNLDKKQISETAFDPESKVERSTKTIKESGSSQNSNSKWNVSVEQNVPGGEASASKPTDQSRRSNERKEETTNFEVSSKTTSTVSDGYRIENIAVAVVVNRKHLVATAADKNTGMPVEEQVKSVEKLVASAAGLVPARGDKVTVAAVDFAAGTELEPLPAPTIAETDCGPGGQLHCRCRYSSVDDHLHFARPAPGPAHGDRKPSGPNWSCSTRLNSRRKASSALTIEAAGIRGGRRCKHLQPPPPPDPVAVASAKKQSLIKQVEKAINENEQQAVEILKEWIKEA